jgi:hypothetical protein
MLAPGSYLVISVGFGRGREGTDFASTYNAQNGPRIYAHSWEEITGLFDGLELVPPGIAETSEWHPGQPGRAVGDRESMIVAGVARRPLTPVGHRHRRHQWQRVVLPQSRGRTREAVTCPCRHSAGRQEPAQCGNATVVRTRRLIT